MVAISLADNNLRGELAPELGQLTALRLLSLSGNYIGGSIPFEYVRLARLENIDLAHNNLGDGFAEYFFRVASPDFKYWEKQAYIARDEKLISEEDLKLLLSEVEQEDFHSPLWANLLWLNRERYKLDEQAFRELLAQLVSFRLQGWRNLASLGLSFNQFNQSIPASLASADRLTRIDLSVNQFNGSIPSDIGLLIHLEDFNLADNNLAGNTPNSLGSLSALRYLNLGSNQLRGPVLYQLQGCANLEEIRLGWNQFSGQLPHFAAGRWPALSILEAHRNAFTGPVPEAIGSLASATRLDLSYNQLSGPLPAGLAGCTSLRLLDLSYNRLSGAVPPEVAALPALRSLWANDNQLTGLPDFRNAPNLGVLELEVSGNRLCFGPLETQFTGFGAYRPAYLAYLRQSIGDGEDTETQSVTEPIELTCSFSGTRNAYQWQKKDAAGNWQNLSGATATVWRVAAPATADAGRYRCEVTNRLVMNLTLYTRVTNLVLTPAPTVAAVPDQGVPDLDRNWTIERTYDGEGNDAANVLTETKQFTDGLGRATQTQARSRANPHVFASQTIYSTGGQPVVQTLAAPINNQSFAYKENFAAVYQAGQPAQNGNPAIPPGLANFGPANFEGAKASNPDLLDATQPGTLGYYFSPNNALEPLTPATGYPYSLNEPAEGPLGGVKRAAAPGETYRMGAGHEGKGREIPLLKEFDHYLTLRHHFVPGSSNNVTLQRQGTKSISVDADGRESIVVANKDGQALVSCLSGPQYPPVAVYGHISTNPPATGDADTPSFLDIHIPAAGEHQLDFTLGGSVLIQNLNDEAGVKQANGGYAASCTLTYQTGPNARASVWLLPGFYRLTSLPSANANEQTQWFSYQAEYGNFSYTYYDDAGRVVATVAPNGLSGNNVLRNPGFEQEQAATNTPSAWDYTGTPGASYTQAGQPGQPAHGGSLFGAHWSLGPHTAHTTQALTGLPNGRYVLRAWVQGTGGFVHAGMTVHGHGGPQPVLWTNIPNQNSWEPWQQIEISNINIINGSCIIGFYSESTGGKWIAFDDVVLARMPGDGTEAPEFATRNTYDTGSRLLATESTDEGRTEYVYARDGRIRFSQSALQRPTTQQPTGRFSYSNYDEQGRVVESGEYTAAGPGAHVFQSQLPLVAAYEAEDAVATNRNGTTIPVATNYAGFRGRGFIGDLTAQGDKVQFNVSAPVAGNYLVRVRYAAEGPTTRSMVLYRGNGYQFVSFPSTGSWSRWDMQTVEVTLAAGGNQLTFQHDGRANEGWVNFDYLELLSEPTPAATSVLNLLEERSPTNSLLAANCAQQNYVTYDRSFTDPAAGTPEPILAGRTQKFVQGAVSRTSNDKVTTYYSYDELGRVTWVVQDIAGLGPKTLDYTYDFAGNVLEVAYQHGQADAFHHYYQYDRGQRLYKVYTSTDGTDRTLEAKYFYYLHGPLKRTELANRLQGLDYTYTLQGWLKSLNHVETALDPGRDAPRLNGVEKDLFSLTLDYFSGDYRSAAQPISRNPTGLDGPANPFRYDGTIRAAAWRTAASPQRHQTVYEYDVKSQLAQSTYGTLGAAGPAFGFTPSPTRAYQEGGLTYDPNGNTQALRRTDKTGAATDNFSYEYTPGTNRLATVHDNGSSTGPAVLGYEYDVLGQMTHETEGGEQRYLKYDVTGKVTGIYRDANRNTALATFTYDDKGFRHSKKSYDAFGDVTNTTTYVRDVAGNVLSTYENSNATLPVRTEVPLYGAGRVGVLTRLDADRTEPRYELNDHLGNARVVFHRPTTVSTTASFELGADAQQEDSQWTGLTRLRTASSTAHQGTTTPSDYVGRLPVPAAGSRAAASITRTVTVQKGDTLTFSAWAYLRVAPNIGSTPSGEPKHPGLRVLPLPVPLPAGASEAPPVSGGWLSRLRLGVALVGWNRGSGASHHARPLPFDSRVWLRTTFTPDDRTQAPTVAYTYLTDVTRDTWQPFQTGLRAPAPGTVQVAIGSDDPAYQADCDDLRLDHSEGLIVQEQHTYAYGAPLTGLNYAVGTRRYRYGYQGQFAEQDPETGRESFELRLYSSRIGRWTSYDPEGQFSSPYVGMGNNPVSGTDPDGGLTAGMAGYLIGAAAGGTFGAIKGYQSGGMTGMWGGMVAGITIGGFAGGLVGMGVGAGLKALGAPTAKQIGATTFRVAGNKIYYGPFDGTAATRPPGDIADGPAGARGASLGIILPKNDKVYQTATTNQPGSEKEQAEARSNNLLHFGTDSPFGPSHKPEQTFIDNGYSTTNPYYGGRGNGTNAASGVNSMADTPHRLERVATSWRGETSIMNSSGKVRYTISWGYDIEAVTGRVTLMPLKVHRVPSQIHSQLFEQFTGRRL